MTHPCIEVADAVVSRLNAASVAGNLSQKVSASREYLPDVVLHETDGVVILVIAHANSSTTFTRKHDEELPAVRVVIWKKLDGREKRHIDPMLTLVQEIDGVLRASLDDANAGWVGRTSDPIYDEKDMHEHGLFHSETTFTYRVIHDVRIAVG